MQQQHDHNTRHSANIQIVIWMSHYILCRGVNAKAILPLKGSWKDLKGSRNPFPCQFSPPSLRRGDLTDWKKKRRRKTKKKKQLSERFFGIMGDQFRAIISQHSIVLRDLWGASICHPSEEWVMQALILVKKQNLVEISINKNFDAERKPMQDFWRCCNLLHREAHASR